MGKPHIPYGTPEYREYRQANRYGMTVTELRTMLESRDYKCDICERDVRIGRWAVDHDAMCCDGTHKKNACGKCNRGILCQRCNVMVGHIEFALYDNIHGKILKYLGH